MTKVVLFISLLSVSTLANSWGQCVWVDDGRGTRTQICSIW